MNNCWVPYLTAQINQRSAQDNVITPPRAEYRPWGLYVTYLAFALAFAIGIFSLYG